MKTESRRIPLLALALLALLAALWGGWIRIGWDWPVLQPALIAAHGALMVCGFLGTLIALERAVALHSMWMYTAPLLTGIGSLAFILGFPDMLAKVLITAGSLVLIVIFYIILHQHMAPYTAVMALGSISWFIGNLLWLFGWPIFLLVPWWIGFLVLTIAGERLELGRVLRLNSTATNLFYVATAVLLLGLLLGLWVPQVGTRLVGLGMLMLAVWLSRYDISRRTVRQIRLPRFAAISLLTGYFWLGVGGVLALIYGPVPAGPTYDAILHSVFVGFTMSMIFGHAPIIFPAVLGLPIRYSWSYYLPLILLDFSLFLRIIGDLLLNPSLRMWGGLLNGIAILLFFLLMVIVSIVSNKNRVSEERKILSGAEIKPK